MSKPFINFDPTGVYVEGAGYTTNPSPNDFVFGHDIDPFSFTKHYRLNGQLTPRPVAPSPISIDGGWSVANCVIGTIITIRDVIGNETMAEIVTTTNGQSVDFSLSDVGLYEIEVNAPLPYVDTRTNIEVI